MEMREATRKLFARFQYQRSTQMKPRMAAEMRDAWKTRKTKARVPCVSHSPWKSLRDSRISATRYVFQTVKTKLKKGRPSGR
jgi:hypothetical protein